MGSILKSQIENIQYAIILICYNFAFFFVWLVVQKLHNPPLSPALKIPRTSMLYVCDCASQNLMFMFTSVKESVVIYWLTGAGSTEGTLYNCLTSISVSWAYIEEEMQGNEDIKDQRIERKRWV